VNNQRPAHVGFGKYFSFRSWRQALAKIFQPLSVRERIVYGFLALGFVMILIGPRAGAGVTDEGLSFAIPSRQCSSPAGWSQIELVPGQADVGAEEDRTLIDQSNAAYLTGDSGELVCSAFNAEIPGHTRINNRVTLSINAFQDSSDTTAEETSPDIKAESSDEEIVINTASLNAVQVEESTEIITPNAYAKSDEIDLDGILLLSVSSDSGASWSPMHKFGNEVLNFTSPHVSIKLPDEFVENQDRLAFKLESISTSEETQVFVDSIFWAYTVGRAQELTLQLSDENGIPAAGDTPLIDPDSTLNFKISSKDTADGLWQGLRSRAHFAVSSADGPQIEVNAILKDQDGKIVEKNTAEIDWQGVDYSNTHSWDGQVDIIPPSADPGKYTLIIEIADSEGLVQTITQDFLWGVLAVNTNKADYALLETGQIMMSVLDEKGRTVCDAELELLIKGPSNSVTLSTEKNTIEPSETCDEYGPHIDADYFSENSFTELGLHEMKLTATTENGTYSISDTVTVSEDQPFVIERSGPTRIFPLLDYPITINLQAKEDFNGIVEEHVPNSFVISNEGSSLAYDELYSLDDTQVLRWKVDLKAGEAIKLGYQFDAPNIAPEFYVLGPISLKDSEENEIFTENRQWQIAGDAVGRMLLFYDGATIPTGWTCVSCSSGDPFYQTFIRGASTYGGTGGSTTHTHTADGNVSLTADSATGKQGNGNIAINTHAHTYSPTLNSPSNIPNYRQLKVIRYDTAGEPATLPAGVIGIFDATVPSGWTQYSAQNGYFIRGENTAGTTGGSNTHTVSISGTTGSATGGDERNQTGGTQVGVATLTHDHNVSGTSAPASNQPPFTEVILGQLNSSAAPPNDMIAMWDEEAAVGWQSVSGSGDPLNNQFIKGSATYGTTGGSTTHTHTDTNLTSTAPNQTTTTRSGSDGASSTHTHAVTVSNYSSENHLPPYRDVYMAKRAAMPTYEQTGYRWFDNDNSADVGSPLASQNTAATAPAQSTPFRLRMLVHVTVQDMTTSYENLKLQYAERSGSCDIGFSGETYQDVGTASGAIRFHDNSSPVDGDALTSNGNDPTHSGHTIVDQTYEEANNFTNSQGAISVGEDGMWDFSLVDFSAVGSTPYCFRIVKSGGTELNSYSQIAELTTAPPPPNMVLLYDGATIPTGWTCVSCTGGDEAYQRFIRGETTSSTGGNATHNHTATGTVALSSDRDGRPNTGTGLAIADHTHTITPSIGDANNLPAYRQLKVIKYDSGTPAVIPSGAIALFDATVPAGFTRYSAQDGSFVRGEGTAGTTGGSNTHTNPITGTTSASGGAEEAYDGSGSQEDVAVAGHTHTINGNTDSVDIQPPFIETYLGQADSDTSIPGGIITMWDADPGGTWTCVSCTGGDPFYQRFFKPANGYGTTGGSVSHTHGTSVLTSSVPDTITATRAQNSLSADTHTHDVTIDSFSTDNHLPLYIDYVFAKSPSSNTAPNDPTSLGQEMTDSTVLSVGDWTNESTVVFTASASDPDNPDTVALCVEVQPIATSFTNSDTACGSAEAYSGSPVAVEVSVSGLVDTTEYHWQARTKDGLGVYSGWVSFGGNAESARDVGVDTSSPTGTVYDGSTTDVDIDLNGGSLNTLSANWNIDSSSSGLSEYEYSIGTTPGSIDVRGWTSTGTTDFVTATSLILNTSQPYYFNVRTTDNAGSQSVLSSDGILVAPTLSFSSSPGSVTFGTLDSGNGYTATSNTTLTTSTNAYNGYAIRAYLESLLTNGVGSTIGVFNGGTYASPDAWGGGDTGYGYTSSDTLVQGANIFNGSPCAGGGSPPCYAPFSLTQPGDIIADHTSTISGTPVINENFTITHRVTSSSTQESGEYTTTVIYSVTAIY
jgi:hypothetical protein